jgi:hypothetical protein
MRIMLAITTMTAGGAERVAATLVNYWTAEGHQVALVTVASTNRDFYPLDYRVTRFALDLSHPTNTWRDFVMVNLNRITKLRSAIRKFKPDIILSFIDTTNVRVLLASIGTGRQDREIVEIPALQTRLCGGGAYAGNRSVGQQVFEKRSYPCDPQPDRRTVPQKWQA